MVLRIFKSFWFLSVLVALGDLLMTYASFPEQVVVREEASKLISLPRDGIFYIAVAIMALANVMVYFVAKMYSRDNAFRIWFYGLIITLNIFFVVALSLLNTFNSGEHFKYNNIDFIIYGSVSLIVLWALAWPFYFLYRKISTKQTV